MGLSTLDWARSRLSDKYRHLLHPPTYDCSHGYDDRCACQLPWYDGLFVIPFELPINKRTTHRIVRVQLAYDGGMVEFHDPITDDVVGSGGINWWFDNGLTLDDFLERVEHG